MSVGLAETPQGKVSGEGDKCCDLPVNLLITRLGCFFYVTAILGWVWDWGWFKPKIEVKSN